MKTTDDLLSKDPPWPQAFAYVQGSVHKHQNTLNQDYGSWTWGESPLRYLIVSVSDGAGSALFAKESAQVVTKISLATLEGFVKKNLFSAQGRKQVLTQKLGEILVAEIQEGLLEESRHQGGKITDFCSTLLSVVMVPEGIFVFQVGDSYCVHRNAECDQYTLTMPLQRGNFVNETNFISHSDAAVRMTTYTQKEIPEFLALATDGLESVSLSHPDSSPYAPFFSPLEEFLKKKKNLKAKNEELKKFLESDRLNERSPDDKTLFVAYFPPGIFLRSKGQKKTQQGGKCVVKGGGL